MFSVYILYSNSIRKYYIGYTSDLDQRIAHHNSGKNTSTKKGAPWSIVHAEQYSTKKEAWLRERQIKSYKGGEAFKKLIQNKKS